MTSPRLLAIALAIAAIAAVPATALARHGGNRGKSVTGNCTGNATSKLKVKPDNGRLETEVEVDQNLGGVRWSVTIKRHGKTAVKTSRRTKAPSGSFSVERRLADGPGRDRISARAKSSSGQVCTASLTI
jgi:hypothetical protein